MPNEFTHVSSALVAPRRDDEAHATLTELAACPDRMVVDVRIGWWLDTTGRPYALQVCSLSATDEYEISLAAAEGWLAEWAAVLVRGVIAPKIDAAAAARLLRTKNPRACEELVRFIRSLAAMSPAALQAAIIVGETLVFELPETIPALHLWPGATTPEIQETPNNEAIIIPARVRAVAA